jgi:hypothetical protein
MFVNNHIFVRTCATNGRPNLYQCKAHTTPVRAPAAGDAAGRRCGGSEATDRCCRAGSDSCSESWSPGQTSSETKYPPLPARALSREKRGRLTSARLDSADPYRGARRAPGALGGTSIVIALWRVARRWADRSPYSWMVMFLDGAAALLLLLCALPSLFGARHNGARSAASCDRQGPANRSDHRPVPALVYR